MIIQECQCCRLKKDDVEELLVPSTDKDADTYKWLCEDCYDELDEEVNG